MTRPSLVPHLGAGERRRFLYASVAFVCAAAAGLVARTCGDVLFLSAFGSARLPYMYIGSALLVMLVSYCYGAWLTRLPPERLTVAAASLLALSALALRGGLATGAAPFRVAAYFFADLSVQLPMLLFWGFAALVFNPREGKRLFGMIGASGTAACILCGFALKPVAARFGTDNLVALVALLHAGFAATVLLYSLRQGGPAPGAAGASTGSTAQPRRLAYYATLLRQPQTGNLALLVSVSTVVVVLVDYQFKTAVRAHYQGAALAGFLGAFYGFANAAGLVLQLFFVHRILARGGVLPALGVLPACFLVTALAVVATTSFASIVALKIVDPILSFTVSGAAMQMLYLGVRRQTRGQTRAFAEGMCKPLAMATSAALLVAAGQLAGPRGLGGAVAVLAVVWLLVNRRNYASYIAGLVDSVGAHRFEGSQEYTPLYDKTLDEHLRQALVSSPDEDVPYLIGVVTEMGSIDPAAEVRRLLARDDTSVKVAALTYLRGRTDTTDLEPFLAHATHPHAEVRVAAVRALRDFTQPAVLAVLEGRLEDPVPAVRAAAAAELINAADLDGLLAAGVTLKGLLSSPDPESRIAATDALAFVKHTRLTRLIRTLLQDPNDLVLLAALPAARTHASAELIPSILPLLARPVVATAAADTLVAFGEQALEALVEPFTAAADARGITPWILRVPSIVARIGSRAGLPLLERALAAPDLELRAATIAGYCQLLRLDASSPARARTIDAVAARELELAHERLRLIREVESLPDSELLVSALREVQEGHLRNALALLDAGSSRVDMNAILFGLTRSTPEARAQALELIDNVIGGESKARLLHLFESGAALTSAPDRDRAGACIAQILESEPPEWVASGALFAAGRNRIASAAGPARRWLAHPSAVVRETAVFAAAVLGGSGALSGEIDRLQVDESPAVRTALLAALTASAQR